MVGVLMVDVMLLRAAVEIRNLVMVAG